MNLDTDTISQLEMSVIGAILLHPDNLAVLPSLETDDFQNLRPKATWGAIRNLEAVRAPIDITTIGDELAKMGCLDQVGFDWLGRCALTVPTVTNAIEYANRLKDNALRWRLIQGLSAIVEAGRSGQATGAEMLGLTLATTSHLDAEQPEDASTIGDVVKRRIKQIEQVAADMAAGRTTMTGFKTGVEKLDEKIGGWQPGIVSIVAARPAMGKSSLGLATADACSKDGHGVHLFSLEDTEQSYADRALSRTSGVDAERIRSANLKGGDMGDMANAMRNLSRRQGWLFDGRSGITAAEIVRSVRRRKKKNGTRVVIVDYIQLVSKPHPRMSTHEALGETITTLADAAKHDGIAYVVMSQLNREIEKRDDKRPLLADLRESGSLEERAKCVVGIYRGAAYKLPPKRGVDFDCDCKPVPKDDKTCVHTLGETAFQSQVQLHVLKNSNGRTGKVTASWHGPTTKVE
jgi:replicative DNA helicase